MVATTLPFSIAFTVEYHSLTTAVVLGTYWIKILNWCTYIVKTFLVSVQLVLIITTNNYTVVTCTTISTNMLVTVIYFKSKPTFEKK